MAELAALGVASSILQVVDFGAKVVKTAYKLAKTPGDALDENVELEALATEQNAIAERLQSSLESRSVLSANEEAVVKIAAECGKQTSELISLLSRLKVADSSHSFQRIINTTKAAVKNHRKRDQVDSLREQLQLTNARLSTALLVVMKYACIGIRCLH